jgi:hypothetical protein
MAIYTSNTVADADKEIPRRLGNQLGLFRLDSHWLTDDDAISPISVRGAEERGERRSSFPTPTSRSGGIPTATTTCPSAPCAA